jgi:hypothetical protein
MEGGGNVRSYKLGHGATFIENVDFDQGLPRLTSFEFERIVFY